MTGDSVSFETADQDDSGDLSRSELEALTKAQIKAIADEKGYTLTGTTKNDLIESFLAAQAGG